MRITVNGKKVEGLSRGLEKRIAARSKQSVAEGAVLSAEQAEAVVARGLRLMYNVVAAICAVVTLAAIAAAAAYEPRDLVLVAPLAVVVAIGVGGLLVWGFRRHLAKVRGRAAAYLPQMPTTGERLSVEEAGLVVGGRCYAWADLQIDEMDVTQTNLNDEQVALIERMRLTAGSQRLVLDCLLIANGRAVVDAAWLRLRAAEANAR